MERLATLIEPALPLLPQIGGAIAALLVAWALSRVLASAAERLLATGRFTRTHRSFLVRLVRWTVLATGVAVALELAGLQGLATPLLAGGGATAVVLGFAFREIGENFLAGVLLAFDSPFDEGDRISVGDHEGEVRTIGPRMTHIRTNDGRDVYVPNSQVVNGVVTNFTVDGLRRPSFRIGIDYGNDAARACQIAVQVTSQVAGVQPEPAPRALLAEFDANWVTLEIAFWIDTFEQDQGALAIRSACMERVRRALLDEGFTVSSETTANHSVRLSRTDGAPVSPIPTSGPSDV